MLEQIVEALVGVGDLTVRLLYVGAELLMFLRPRLDSGFYAGDAGLANLPNGFYANIGGLYANIGGLYASIGGFYLRTKLGAHVLNDDPNNTYGYGRKRGPRQEILNCHGGFHWKISSC